MFNKTVVSLCDNRLVMRKIRPNVLYFPFPERIPNIKILENECHASLRNRKMRMTLVFKNLYVTPSLDPRMCRP